MALAANDDTSRQRSYRTTSSDAHHTGNSIWATPTPDGTATSFHRKSTLTVDHQHRKLRLRKE